MSALKAFSAKAREVPMEMRVEFARAFFAMDGDGDLLLDEKEMMASLVAEGVTYAAASGLNTKLFAAYDENGDRKITLDEYVRYRKHLYELGDARRRQLVADIVAEATSIVRARAPTPAGGNKSADIETVLAREDVIEAGRKVAGLCSSPDAGTAWKTASYVKTVTEVLGDIAAASSTRADFTKSVDAALSDNAVPFPQCPYYDVAKMVQTTPFYEYLNPFHWFSSSPSPASPPAAKTETKEGKGGKEEGSFFSRLFTCVERTTPPPAPCEVPAKVGGVVTK